MWLDGKSGYNACGTDAVLGQSFCWQQSPSPVNLVKVGLNYGSAPLLDSGRLERNTDKARLAPGLFAWPFLPVGAAPGAALAGDAAPNQQGWASAASL